MALDRQSVIFASQNLDHSLLVLHLTSYLTESGEEIQCYAVPLVSRRRGMMLAMPMGVWNPLLVVPGSQI